MSRRSPNPIRAERGAVVVVALFMVLSLALMGISINHVVAVDLKVAGNYRDSLSTLYVAESGIEHTIALLNYDPEWRGSMADDGYAMDVSSHAGSYPQLELFSLYCYVNFGCDGTDGPRVACRPQGGSCIATHEHYR